MTTATKATDIPLVRIVTLQGDEYDQAVQAAEAAGGSTDAVAAHLARWDYGDEADSAALLFPRDMPTADELSRLSHQLHEATAGGLHYWLLIDHQLRLYGLYREPLED